MRAKNVPVSGTIILEKSQDFATQLGIENWLFKWKNLFDIKFKDVVGEGNKLTPEMVAPSPGTRRHCPSFLSKYDLGDIYNLDEFGLFYQSLPKKTMHMQGKKCAGGKHSKLRSPGLTAHQNTFLSLQSAKEKLDEWGIVRRVDKRSR